MNINADMIDSLFVTPTSQRNKEKEKGNTKYDNDNHNNEKSDTIDFSTSHSKSSWDDDWDKNEGDDKNKNNENKEDEEKSSKVLLHSEDEKTFEENDIISTSLTSQSIPNILNPNQIASSDVVVDGDKNLSQTSTPNCASSSYYPKIQWRLLAEGKRIYTADFIERYKRQIKINYFHFFMVSYI